MLVEVGAILYDLGRQPRAAHDFFVKYQNRILFGKDAFEPEEYPYYWRVFETKDEYFDYYRDYHAFWKLYGMDLPDDVLHKLYLQNAERIIPNMPNDGRFVFSSTTPASLAIRSLQMRTSSGMPISVSPSARTEHGCMRQ